MTYAHRLSLTALAILIAGAPVAAQTPENVTVGVVSFLQYSADLHEADNFNAFDVTRGYINIEAKLSDHLRIRFTPDVRPTTDASLQSNLTLRLEYASLEARVSDRTTLYFGMHDMPWLTFEESINRYRVMGPFFAERVGLIPGPTDLGASLKVTGERTEVHVGIYNGEGNGRQETDKYKNVDARVTVHPFDKAGPAASVGISAFYQYGWYAKDRPRNVLIVMGSYDTPKLAATAQWLSATDNPFLAQDVKRRGLSFFGEGRQGPTGWAAVGGVDYFQPDILNENDWRRRYVFGGAHWSRLSHGRLGVVVTLEQTFQGTTTSELTGRRLLAQTHVEF
jgi:hypothetical protein